MNIRTILKPVKKHLPLILSIAGAVGTVATAILSAHGTIKAIAEIDSEEIEKKRTLERDELIKAAWKCYIPTALTAIATVACILGSGAISRKQQASLIGAYTLLAGSYKKYREKVREVYGKEADAQILSAMSHVEHSDQTVESQIHTQSITGDLTLDWGDDEDEVQHLFYDTIGGRYFTASKSKVYQAEIALNRNLALGGCVSLNDFYEFLGIETVTGGDDIVWCVCDSCYFMEFNHYRTRLTESPDGEHWDAYIIDYEWIPESYDNY